MLPIKLTLTAFGAYAGKTEIDFEKLGKEGIYLITGDTGAGKTTVFDGIIFALYGEFSGQNRSVQMARSAYANEKDKTSAELVFECSGKRYVISRKLNIDKEMKVTQKVQLEYDQKVISKKSDVDREIENIVGVNKDQFRQIIMLAQGDFQKMLFAKSTERQEILRKILNTESYNLFGEKLKERFLVTKKKYEIKQNEMLALVGSVNFYGFYRPEEVEELKQRILGNPVLIEEFCGQLGSINRQDEEKFRKAKSDYEQNQKEYQKLCEEINSIEKNNSTYMQVESLKSSLEEISLLCRQNNQKSQEINEKNQPQIEKALQEVSVLKQSLDEYQKLDDLIAEIDKLSKYGTDMQASFARGQAKLEKVQGELAALAERQKVLKNSSAGYEQFAAEREQLIARQNLLVSAAEKFLKYQQKKKEYEKFKSDYIKAEQLAAEQENKARYSRKLYDSERAGIMAENLADGEPCPVCGSIHHPNKAVKTDETIDKNIVEQAEEYAKKMRENASRLCSGCESLKAICIETGNNIKEIIDSLGITVNELKTETERVKTALAEIELKIKEENQRKSELEKLETKIPEKQAEIEDINSKLAKLNTDIGICNATIKEKSLNRDTLKNRLKFAGRQQAENEIAGIESVSRKLRQEMEHYKNLADKSERDLINVKARIDNVQLPHDYKPVDISEKLEQTNSIKTENSKMLSDIQAIGAKLMNNKNIFEKISAELEKIKNLADMYNQLEILSKIAGGTSAYGKMRFEAFVQVKFFEKILKKANVQLKIMSEGRFEFIRKNVPNDGRTDHTLDIDIYDYYSGKSRDVKSLSGGESFIASLSLALGLSQSVQENAGGIQIETMFVDEGFGTLDDNILNQAMNALSHLSQGNRLIGIISHVDLLKKSITKQISVKKDGAKGSKIEIIV